MPGTVDTADDTAPSQVVRKIHTTGTADLSVTDEVLKSWYLRNFQPKVPRKLKTKDKYTRTSNSINSSYYFRGHDNKCKYTMPVTSTSQVDKPAPQLKNVATKAQMKKKQLQQML